MKSLSIQAVAPQLAIQALCASLLFNMSPVAGALATTVTSDGSTAGTHASPAGIGAIGSGTAPLDLLESGASARVPASVIIRSTGAIEHDVDLFRALLGGSNNGATPGQQASGRREINWDGVPAAFTNVPNFPEAFFNTNSPRGLVYEPTGHGLEVSNQSYVDVNRDYAGLFLPFSGSKVFSPIGTIATEAVFFVAGSTTKAAVRGVGVVFLDVDRSGSSGLELLGENGLKLGTFLAPPRSDRRGASFIGVVFRDPLITHVHIRTGDGELVSNQVDITQGGHHDLVVMDDIIYGEPTAIAP